MKKLLIPTKDKFKGFIFGFLGFLLMYAFMLMQSVYEDKKEKSKTYVDRKKVVECEDIYGSLMYMRGYNFARGKETSGDLHQDILIAAVKMISARSNCSLRPNDIFFDISKTFMECNNARIIKRTNMIRQIKYGVKIDD